MATVQCGNAVPKPTQVDKGLTGVKRDGRSMFCWLLLLKSWILFTGAKQKHGDRALE